MLNLVLVFTIVILFFSVGLYHIMKGRGKSREYFPAILSYGIIWIDISLAYLCVGLGQIFHNLRLFSADQRFFYLNYYFALGVIVPAYYFSSYLIWGDKRLSRYLLIAALALLLMGIGLISSTPSQMREYSWGSTWDFQRWSLAIYAYFLLVGFIPLGLSFLTFIFYLFPKSTSKRARYHLAMTTLAFMLMLISWAIITTRSSAILIASRLIALAAGFAAHLAYFPTSKISRYLEKRIVD